MTAVTRTGLLVIDAQRDYFPGGVLPLVGIEPAAEVAAAALERARDAGTWIGVVRHEGEEGGLLAAGTPGAELDPRFEPRPDERLIVKREPNAFLGTGLLELLGGAAVDRLTVVGFMSSMCVDATTRAGSDLGFTMTVVEDACATPDLEHEGRRVPAPDVQAAFLAALGSAYATVVPADELG